MYVVTCKDRNELIIYRSCITRSKVASLQHSKTDKTYCPSNCKEGFIVQTYKVMSAPGADGVLFVRNENLLMGGIVNCSRNQ